jgi:multiple sugar transport system substrate-binding protein
MRRIWESNRWRIPLALVTVLFLLVWTWREQTASEAPIPPNRREVVFWHFWGGRDRPVVEEIVRRFNESQEEHFVRAVAMPGHNLDLKFFLSTAGGDPPDLLNQDDPIIADWAHRDALMPLDELAPREQLAELSTWLFPAARELVTYDGRMFGLCNGLDIRALYCDLDALEAHGLEVPRTLVELDRIARRIAPSGENGGVGTAQSDAQRDGTSGGERGGEIDGHRGAQSTGVHADADVSASSGLGRDGQHDRFGYLPDPRRLWAWGIVFGGSFYDPATGQVTADSEPIVAALEWMSSYSDRYGAQAVAAYRKGDQALTGASFPLLQNRYAVVMDGQWRVNEIDAAADAARRMGKPPRRFGVVPLPPPPGGRQDAGWVNGNFFVVPRGSSNPQGACDFMKFWSGFDGNEASAARACAEGGWIPVSAEVVRQEAFQAYLKRHPQFETFVQLAGSGHQVATPTVPGAIYFSSEIIRAAEDAMYRGASPRASLEAATRRIQARLDEARMDDVTRKQAGLDTTRIATVTRKQARLNPARVDSLPFDEAQSNGARANRPRRDEVRP